MPTLGSVLSSANIPIDDGTDSPNFSTVLIGGTQVIGSQQAAITALTDSTGGTPAASLVDVLTIAVADPDKINDNFASLNAKLEAYADVLRTHGLLDT